MMVMLAWTRWLVVGNIDHLSVFLTRPKLMSTSHITSYQVESNMQGAYSCAPPLCSLNSAQRQRETERVLEENRILLGRLQKVQPQYKANEWVSTSQHTCTHHTLCHTYSKMLQIYIEPLAMHVVYSHI